MSAGIRLVVGLGNPGETYSLTRHNIGVLVLDALRERGFSNAVLLQPSHYMNESGLSVGPVLRKKGWSPAETLVVCDDFAIPFGRLRIRPNGSSGGHNGLKSIFEVCATQDIPRLRIGIGPVPSSEDLARFVLDRWTSQEKRALPALLERACQAIDVICTQGLEPAMNQFNGLLFEEGPQ